MEAFEGWMLPLVCVAPLMADYSKLKLMCEKFCNKSAVFRQQSALLTFWNSRKHPRVLSLVNHLSCVEVAWNGMADPELLLMLFLQRTLFAYYIWPVWKMENVSWKHGREMAPLWVSLLELCYTEKISNLHSVVFREIPDVINSCFVCFTTNTILFNIIKNIPFYRFHTDSGHWEVFVLFLGRET